MFAHTGYLVVLPEDERDRREHQREDHEDRDDDEQPRRHRPVLALRLPHVAVTFGQIVVRVARGELLFFLVVVLGLRVWHALRDLPLAGHVVASRYLSTRRKSDRLFAHASFAAS